MTHETKNIINNENSISENEQQEYKKNKLVKMALEYGIELFTDIEGETPYTTVPTSFGEGNESYATFEVGSMKFRLWLTRIFSLRFDGAVPAKNTIEDALNTLKAEAMFSGKKYEIFIRVGRANGKIYYDLGNDKGQVVEIDADGWNILDKSPVKFIRPKGMLPQAAPVRGDFKIDELMNFINVQDEQDKILLLGTILSDFRPQTEPYLVLALYGPQDAAKSTVGKLIKSLIDPNTNTARTKPKSEADVLIAAKNCHVLDYDNLSDISRDLSNTICGIATGTSLSKKANYTDSDEHAFYVRRPIIINGIEELATRADLTDRVFAINLTSIEDSIRKSEEDLYKEFEEAKPRILGAIFTAMSTALRNLPNVKFENGSPRMIDATRFITAAETALGWDSGRFLREYQNYQLQSQLDNIEASHIGRALIKLMNNEEASTENDDVEENPWNQDDEDELDSQRPVEAVDGEWRGTSTQLLAAVGQYVPKNIRRGQFFPKNARGLRSSLNLLTKSLKALNLKIEFHKPAWIQTPDGDRRKERLVIITDTERRKIFDEEQKATGKISSIADHKAKKRTQSASKPKTKHSPSRSGRYNALK
jgi:hypothetical protein